MPQAVEKQTGREEKTDQELRAVFIEEQMCASFLTETIRSLYRFDDEFVAGWYEKIFGEKPGENEEARRQLVKACTEMLMFENKYRFHLDHWLTKYRHTLIVKMDSFFECSIRDK